MRSAPGLSEVIDQSVTFRVCRDLHTDCLEEEEAGGTTDPVIDINGRKVTFCFSRSPGYIRDGSVSDTGVETRPGLGKKSKTTNVTPRNTSSEDSKPSRSHVRRDLSDGRDSGDSLPASDTTDVHRASSQRGTEGAGPKGCQVTETSPVAAV